MKMDVYPMLSKSSSFPLIRPNYRRMVSDCAADGEWGGGMKRVDYSLLGGVLVDSASAKVAASGASDSDRPSWITKKETSVVLPRMVAKRFKLMTRAFVTLWKSKLRKREDTLPTTTTATPPATTATTNANHNHNNNVIQHSNNHILSNGVQQQNNNNNSCNQQQQQQTDVIEGPPPPFLWVYHTNGTSTTNSSQYTLYNNDQDTLVHNLQCEEARECKGFRKNLRGKWRRLVKKKPQQEVYTIPAELRDQLKQIYVY